MRINPNPLPDLLAALNETQSQAQEASLQISTGRSVNEPSDNPTAAALLVNNNDEATLTAGYLQSITAVQGQLSTADSTLGSITSALQQALTLGVEAGSGTLGANGQAAILTQLQGIQSQLVSLANTAYQGHYVFAGTDTKTAPFVLDNALPSGVNYVGNSAVNQVSIGSGYKLSINIPGSQLFSAPGNDVFLAINNLIQAVQTNTGIPGAVNAISAASSYLSTQGVFYGTAIDQTQTQTSYLNAAQLQISEQQAALGGVNLATASNDLLQSNTDTQAALEAISKMTQNNLFSYLP